MTATRNPLLPTVCHACGTPDAKNRCGGCRCAYFCDRNCQRQSWPSHRNKCLELSRLADKRTGLPSDSIQCSDIRGAAAASGLPKSVRLVTEPVEIPVEAANSTQEQAKLQKKNKKHKKKRKTRSNSLHVPATAALSSETLQRKNRSASLGAKKHIIWGDVSAREFARFPGGGGAVPYRGTWALGLGQQVADVQLGSVLEVEKVREQTLQERAKKLSKSKRQEVREGETRQFDYRRGVNNPLFARLSECERRQLFSTLEEDFDREDSSETQWGSSFEMKKTWQRYSSGSTASLVAGNKSEETDATPRPLDFCSVSVEQALEFAEIRDSRDGACGCSCGDLIKKVGKMNVKKLRAFLQEHNVLLPGLGKTELMAAAKKLAREQKNCQSIDSDCECARNGVPCHSDACQGCAGDCYNPYQRYEYKSSVVKQYRKEQLEKWHQRQREPETLPNQAAMSICAA
ncbi:hypothetical protein PsorP6_006174 [Peronosclerospora sorghi]|uniref:Uncharacterized protein n=1 Tax=Peronosclerospora sorghi TaxID=230839 RepID=A0ACC0W5L2_9STRA|nr:hypothetical protein PsorP6_006174 [Peronosclerospora sorghi]